MGRKNAWFGAFIGLTLVGGLAACDSDPGPGADEGPAARTDGGVAGDPSNRVRAMLDCDLQGLTGELRIDIEVLRNAGIVWGTGPNPDITAVVGLDDVTYLTSGDLRSPTAHYVFTGENRYADFTDTGTHARFRVRWEPIPNGLRMVVNPFGPGPTFHDCALTSARYL